MLQGWADMHACTCMHMHAHACTCMHMHAHAGMRQGWVEMLGRKEGGGSDGVRLALDRAREQAGQPALGHADEVLVTALVCAAHMHAYTSSRT